MTDSTKKLRHELQGTQRALAEAQGRCKHHSAEHQATAKELEDSRSALLLMLEDLEAGHRKIEQAHQEWMNALDAVNDPIFLHDKEFRILRCNKAYQQRAGIPFHELIGQPYYEVFPKTGAPLPSCLRAMEKTAGEEEEVIVGEAIYRSRAFPIHDEQGVYLYSVHTLEDITDSRHAEAVLQESEVRYHQLFAASPDAVFMLDQTGRFLDCNEAAAQRYGFSRAELLQMSAQDLAAPDLREQAATRVKEALTTGGTFEWRHRRKDGSELPVEINAKPFEMHGQKLIFSIVRDITERKRAGAALQESEEKFRKISESAQDAIIMMADKRISFWNAAAERIFGYTAAEALGQELHALIVPPEGYTRFEHAFPRFHESGEGPIIGKVVEVTALHRGGGELPVELSVSSTQFNGQWHAIGIVRDITERKQAEERLRRSEEQFSNTFHVGPAGMTITRVADGKFIEVNESFLSMFGYSREEVVGHTSTELNMLSPEERNKLIQRQIKSGGLHNAELLARVKSGRLINLLFSSKPMKVDGEDCLLTTLIDITERKQAETQLTEQLDELRRWHETTLGREMRIMELKREVNELLKQAGQAPCYPSAEDVQEK